MRSLLAATLPDARMRRPQLRRGPQAESETWLQGTTGSGIWGPEELLVTLPSHASADDRRPLDRDSLGVGA